MMGREPSAKKRKFLDAKREKKADVAEPPEVFDHVGLLVNQPPGSAELLFI